MRIFIPGLLLAVFLGAVCAGQVAVTTYHFDNRRTGWNSQETVLTPAVVSGTTFGLLASVVLDDQVDAQPLVVPGVAITAGLHPGLHDVAYVVTESNSVYAIDAKSGLVLLQVNLGAPMRYPLGCQNNGPNVGINSTPVIDLPSKTLYVMAYTKDSTGPAYRLHALDLGSLTDKLTPRVVQESHTLTDGTKFNFSATYERQRPALLLANGNVYAGFGSFCDLQPSLSRGWLVGWNGSTLIPVPAKQLLNTQAKDDDDYFLASIWMAGFGPAADAAGNVFVVTGNSDRSGTNYDGVTSLQESVVKFSPNLTQTLSLFTPSNQAALDQGDKDFGSGGVTLLPDQPGSIPHLAVAAGKSGTMYLMNADSLGGFSTTKDNVLGMYGIGQCWCGQSYFQDPVDGMGRVVSSGGRVVGVWKVTTLPAPALVHVKSSPNIGGGQDPGFFTSISSNGTASPIIWALSRPASAQAAGIRLIAFDPESPGTVMKQLYSAQAGTWPTINADANLVPVVANGEVFVASYKVLKIFGVKPAASLTTSAP